MLVLRYAGLLALILWVGGLLVLGMIAAPSIFEVLATRQVINDRVIAGAIFGDILRRFHLVSYACGVVLLGTLLARGIMGPRPLMFAVRVGVSFLMLLATACSGLLIAPRIARIQANMSVAPSSLPEDDSRRIEFGHLHAISTSIQLIPILGGLFLIFRELKD